MADRYRYQFEGSYKPKMSIIDGFVSIGTGGLLNYPDATGSGGQTGLPRALMPGQASAGLPTGWQGNGFSGCVGLLGAGVQEVARLATGVYRLTLSDPYIRCDSVQVLPFVASGVIADAAVTSNSVGLGSTSSTKNQIVIQFAIANVLADLAAGAGFYVLLRLRDSQSGPQ